MLSMPLGCEEQFWGGMVHLYMKTTPHHFFSTYMAGKKIFPRYHKASTVKSNVVGRLARPCSMGCSSHVHCIQKDIVCHKPGTEKKEQLNLSGFDNTKENE